jgi:thiosulfate dehydrogenase
MKTSPVVVACLVVVVFLASRCKEGGDKTSSTEAPKSDTAVFIVPDTSKIPHDKFGDLVRYGRQLMVQTAYYIGPNGIAGKYLGNKMNCSNCHQDAGTKPFSFNLMMSHANYPQYRAREGKVLTLAERVNNCVMRPHNGKPLPLDSKEMVAILSYLRWINSQVPEGAKKIKGEKNLDVEFPERAADPEKGRFVFVAHCQRCHGVNGEGLIGAGQATYTYPLLWGDSAYQPGSSMHRVIKQAQWLKANMPYDSAKWNKPVLTDEEALDVAAFVNNDKIHKRPTPPSFDYPFPLEKAIDYDKAPFADKFTAEQHKFGPYKPIIEYWKANNMKPVY